eukprot:TRINITY_DN22072_c0_g1_i1.p2 TRINITY_DN22072_c0_g1~~TRINITY_DN22072_c0_g1_i1.p2  ORF type:complete len:130 (+),score=37.29 TRINITY_DN22072_c0_g1_i1:69-458(+)
MGNTQAAAKECANVRMPCAGVRVETLEAGNGVAPQRGQRVGIAYEGVNAAGKPVGGKGFFPYGMNQVDKCIDESVGAMTVGETARVTCTPDQFYGPLSELYKKQNVEQGVSTYQMKLVRVKACINVDGC